MMSEAMVVFSFVCMVVTPCLVARAICISNDREGLFMAQPGRQA
jgi:hypothetical protein